MSGSPILEDVAGMNENEEMSEDVERLMHRRFLACLPDALQNKITVLKNNQLKILEVNAQYYQEVYRLKLKYQKLYGPLYEGRRKIIKGEVEPCYQDAKWMPTQAEIVEAQTAGFNFSDYFIYNFENISDNSQGVPNFWFTAFQYTKILSKMIHRQDEPVLKFIEDIKVFYEDEFSFTLEFYFRENVFFSNRVLTKKYFLSAKLNEDSPFEFEGHEIDSCKGCEINWMENMDVTQQLVEKTTMDEKGKEITITKLEKIPSFFDFFKPPQNIDEDTANILDADFEVGNFFCVKLIPKAVLYFTNDALFLDEDDTSDEDTIEAEDEKRKENEDKVECPELEGAQRDMVETTKIS